VAKVFVVTALGCVGVLTLSVWPGVFEDTLFGFPASCLSVPVLVGWFLLVVVLTIRDRARRPVPPAKRRRWGILCVVMMLATMGLLRFHVAQLVTFGCCSAEFRRLADAALGDDVPGGGLPRWIGPYRVDRYGADRQGGVYFRTGRGSSGAPFEDRPTSTGFAFVPNGKDVPPGGPRYTLRHLFGDWYVYQALGEGPP
jgi:hypothetical protein